MRSRLQSIVRHATRKAAASSAESANDANHSSATASANAAVNASAKTASRSRHHNANNVLTKDKDVALWLSYEAAIKALMPNRGQFIRALKEARRQQRKYGAAIGRDADFIRGKRFPVL